MSGDKIDILPQELMTEVRQIINNARENAVRSVDFCRVQKYWHLGRRIFEDLLLSTDKESVLAKARKERLPQMPQEVVKDPKALEFLGLEKKSHYYERELETAIIDHLQDFLLEMGNSFTFVARQKRLLIEDDEFFADLVLYNRLLRCFVVIELKTDKLTHQDLGQLQMYVNYYGRYERVEGENPTVGILLCTEKNDTMVRISLPEDNKTIMASKYELYLPSEEQFLTVIEKEKQRFMSAESSGKACFHYAEAQKTTLEKEVFLSAKENNEENLTPQHQAPTGEMTTYNSQYRQRNIGIR